MAGERALRYLRARGGTRDSGLGARESEALLKSTLNFELWIASSLLNPRHGWKTREMLLRWLPYRSGSWANPHPETAHPHKFRSPFEPEFGLISPVIDLHAADLQAGEGQDDDAQDQDSQDGCGAGGGRRIDGNEGEEAAPVQGGRFRHRDRAERLQIENHADLLEEFRQEAAHSLPHHHDHGGNQRIAEQHARREKNAAVTDAGQKRDAEVSREVLEAVPVEKVFLDGVRAELPVQGHEL